MKRFLTLLPLALLSTACPQNNKGASDGGDGGDNVVQPIITVSGKTFIHPQALAWLGDAGAPAIAGLNLSVDEPLKVALGDPSGHFGHQTLDATGTFSVPNVDTSLIALGLVAGISDPSAGVCPDGGLGGPDAGCLTPRVLSAASGLFDVALNGGSTPAGDLTGLKAYAVPTSFHNQLTAAVTPARIQGFTSGNNGAATLYGAGFILGMVVDSAGHPASGMTLAPSDHLPQFFYVSDDYLSVNQTATGATGLFLYVHTGGALATFKFTVTGHPEYLQRNAGATHDAALVMMVYPGTTPP